MQIVKGKFIPEKVSLPRVGTLIGNCPWFLNRGCDLVGTCTRTRTINLLPWAYPAYLPTHYLVYLGTAKVPTVRI